MFVRDDAGTLSILDPASGFAQRIDGRSRKSIRHGCDRLDIEIGIEVALSIEQVDQAMPAVQVRERYLQLEVSQASLAYARGIALLEVVCDAESEYPFRRLHTIQLLEEGRTNRVPSQS